MHISLIMPNPTYLRVHRNIILHRKYLFWKCDCMTGLSTKVTSNLYMADDCMNWYPMRNAFTGKHLTLYVKFPFSNALTLPMLQCPFNLISFCTFFQFHFNLEVLWQLPLLKNILIQEFYHLIPSIAPSFKITLSLLAISAKPPINMTSLYDLTSSYRSYCLKFRAYKASMSKTYEQ